MRIYKRELLSQVCRRHELRLLGLAPHSLAYRRKQSWPPYGEAELRGLPNRNPELIPATIAFTAASISCVNNKGTRLPRLPFDVSMPMWVLHRCISNLDNDACTSVDGST